MCIFAGMELKEGQKAPAFTLTDQNGAKHSLKDYEGRKLALFFYPKDNTPTCTTEACNLKDNYSKLKKRGIEIVGISPDDEKSHKKFETKFKLPYTLVSDPEAKIAMKYGVWAEKQMFGKKYMGIMRTTFLINEQGRIDHIITKVKSKDHAAQILETWDDV